MTSFIALYSGPSISEAQMIAVSGDHDLVTQVAEALVNGPCRPRRRDEAEPSNEPDTRREVLRLVSLEAADGAGN